MQRQNYQRQLVLVQQRRRAQEAEEARKRAQEAEEARKRAQEAEEARKRAQEAEEARKRAQDSAVARRASKPTRAIHVYGADWCGFTRRQNNEIKEALKNDPYASEKHIIIDCPSDPTNSVCKDLKAFPLTVIHTIGENYSLKEVTQQHQPGYRPGASVVAELEKAIDSYNSKNKSPEHVSAPAPAPSPAPAPAPAPPPPPPSWLHKNLPRPPLQLMVHLQFMCMVQNGVALQEDRIMRLKKLLQKNHKEGMPIYILIVQERENLTQCALCQVPSYSCS